MQGKKTTQSRSSNNSSAKNRHNLTRVTIKSPKNIKINYEHEWDLIMRDLHYIQCSVLLMQLIDAVGGVKGAVTPDDYLDRHGDRHGAYPPPPPDMSGLHISGEFF